MLNQVSEVESAVDEGNVVDSDVNEDSSVVQVIYSTFIFCVVCSSLSSAHCDVCVFLGSLEALV